MKYETETQLRNLYGPVSERSLSKEMQHLDKHCRRFIELSPFLHMATSDGDRLDVSPKGDRPGFVHVLDERRLLIPDWPGNRRLDGLLNLIRHPQIGLIFMIPNVQETLRINGVATIHDDPQWLDLCAYKGKLPITVTLVETQEVYLHCAKAFMRSKLWQPETWPERHQLPTAGEMLRDHRGGDGPVESEEATRKRYSDALY